MSWLFSRALAGEFSAGSCSGGEPSVPSSEIPTPLAYCSHGKMTDRLPRSLSGMTFEHLTDDRGEAVLMSFLADFPARISASQEKVQESAANEAVSGRNLRASLARYDHASSSWKTHQLSLLEGSTSCLETFPRWGSMQNGELFPLKMPVLHTAESGCGLLPTPTAQSYGSNQGGSAGRVGPVRLSLQSMATRSMWPTPTASLGTKGGRVTPRKSREGGTLIEAVSARSQWPTPTVHGNYNRKGATPNSGDGLAAAGGALNPTWVEWLMGWPLGWTSLEPLETDRFRLWLASHGRS
jgi:hypothetical protein